MSPIDITPVVSRAERDAFIQFPWRIYANDPAWVPPLLLERNEFLDQKKHPFFEHGAAALFLARRAGEIVGRIMASDDPNYNAEHNSNVGCFGLFESIDDQEVAAALLGTAADWLRERGRAEIMGPIDYSTNYVCALLLEGFEHPPTILTPHNPPYYAALIEGAGFRKVTDWYAWWFDRPDDARLRLQRISKRFANSLDVKIRPVKMKDLAGESRRLREIYNRAWEKNWGFVPFTTAEFDHLIKELKPLAEPEYTLIAEVGDQPVGFLLYLPDINVALRHLPNGRLFTWGLPIGLAKLLYHKNRLKTGRLVALGVVPEFRRHGVAEKLVLRIIEEAMIKNGVTGECSLILENNRLMNRFLEAIGADRYKTYRIYNRPITLA